MKRQMKNLSKQNFPKLRMRRLRSSDSIRKLVMDTSLSPHNLIQPMFVIEGKNKTEKINSLPGIYRYSVDNLLKEIKKMMSLGIIAIALFPKISNKFKTEDGSEAFNENGLIQDCIKRVKYKFPNLVVISDVALDPFTSHGQDGVLDKTGYILNDATNAILLKQALSHAAAGSDIIAPSDMMDGRIKVIRNGLERNRFFNTKLLSYSAKYASNYYGPFRDAVGSASSLGKADKKTYQMDYSNKTEALREVDLDLREGADIVMVKPALPYLDIISSIKESFKIPVFAYHVSGEYLMIKAAARNKTINEKALVIETLTSIRRAGASSILTYYAKEVAKWLS
jgi:porphobilinogen synthase